MGIDPGGLDIDIPQALTPFAWSLLG
jgi:hypothetical protein